MNINRLRMLVYLNLCACQLKVESFDFAVVNATKAIEIDSKNVKALFRRGTGLMHLQVSTFIPVRLRWPDACVLDTCPLLPFPPDILFPRTLPS